jgi:hypothetical protein
LVRTSVAVQEAQRRLAFRVSIKASASTRASKVSGHGAPVRLTTVSAEIAEAQRFNVTSVPIQR